ncbi:uncharacterized protein J4E88_009685 [Alternaria novae-zelandiae]|uniref:uncharacterized protein n=1 Tax=Alternaria novae-zelandiae TaxID=430562 RepID=UPI0020C4B6AA|nr:uncharacterized protein J4E88_009685 [Alternaria novae-zelandiae]KAI4670933.1 hypothetical protein J4E88_009685 [Alternaria novae-zelandiae]
MAPTRITLEDVQAWAIRDFPDEFKHLPDAGVFRTQFNIIRDRNHNNSFKSFVIGSTYTKTRKPVDLMAWLAGPRIIIGYIGKNRKGEPQVRHMTLTEENASSWSLEFPFNLIPPTHSQTEVACCDAMLRYYFLAKGWSEGVIDDSSVFNRFVSRFPYALRAVAEAVAETPEPVPTPYASIFPPEASRVPIASANYQSPYPERDPYLFEHIANDPLPSQSYTVLSSPSPSPPPVEDPITPQVFRSPLELQTRSGHLEPVNPGGDKIVALDGSNDADERDSSGLRNKLFDLNIRLMIAEGLARDAETAARTAQEEAQLWRKRYEEAELYRIKYEEIRSHFGLQEQDERRT